MIKLELLVGLVILTATIYALVDCAMTPQESVTNLPKWAWLLIILFLGQFAVGSIAWFIAGRPKKNPRPPRRRGVIPPDDNPDFLNNL